MFTAAEIAEAAGVPVGDVRALLRSGQALAYRDFVARPDAVRIVRALRGSSRTRARLRPPLTLAAEPRRRGTISLVASGSLHAAFFALMLAGAWLGLLQAADTEQTVKDDSKTSSSI